VLNIGTETETVSFDLTYLLRVTQFSDAPKPVNKLVLVTSLLRAL